MKWQKDLVLYTVSGLEEDKIVADKVCRQNKNDEVIISKGFFADWFKSYRKVDMFEPLYFFLNCRVLWVLVKISKKIILQGETPILENDSKKDLEIMLDNKLRVYFH